MTLTPDQKLEIAGLCYDEEDQKPGTGRGHERREAVIQSILVKLRPSYKGVKMPLIIWIPMTWWLSDQIADVIEWCLRVWHRNHGRGWINFRKTTLMKEIANAASIK